MINVAFLLLVFFLMTASLAPRDPVEIRPPTAEVTDENGIGTRVLTISSNGQIWRDGALIADIDTYDAPALMAVELRVDRSFDAEQLAQFVARLTKSGVQDIRLRTRKQSQ